MIVNEHLDGSWDERIDRLAFGLQFVDPMRGDQPTADVVVVREDVPRPVTIRPGPTGVGPDIGLPVQPVHRNGRFAVVYPQMAPDDPRMVEPAVIDIRVFDARRRYVPRRLRVETAPLQQVVDEDRASRQPPYPRVKARGRAVALYPGSAYAASGATGIRSRVEHNDGTPAQWARVWATTPGTQRIEGVAHADDRGEFLLLLRSTNALLAALPSLTRDVELHVAVPPTGTSSPGDPDLDPLSALPLEVLPAPGQPDPVSAGDRPPADYAIAIFTTNVTCRMGRVVGSAPLRA